MTAAGSPDWMRRESLIGMPSSAVIVWAISSLRFTIPSRILRRNSLRIPTEVLPQLSKASRAAATAHSTSSSPHEGICPITSSFAGLTTSMNSPVEDVVQAPLRYISCRLCIAPLPCLNGRTVVSPPPGIRRMGLSITKKPPGVPGTAFVITILVQTMAASVMQPSPRPS